MRRVLISIVWLVPAVAVAACGSGGSQAVATGQHGRVYRDSAGWTVDVPPGWHVVRFTDSKTGVVSAGVQLSNVRLPAPSLLPGYPIQVNNRDLPARGVGLIIATDTDPRLSRGFVAVPPLPGPDGRGWDVGSSLGGRPPCRLVVQGRREGLSREHGGRTAQNWTGHDLVTGAERAV